MNLHGIVSGYVGAVNPLVTATIQIINGYMTSADGDRVATYAPAVTTLIQIQALQYSDIAQLDGLNIQGVRRKVYLNGDWSGLVRADGVGGDLLQFPEFPGGPVKQWLAAFVFESWPDWTCLACTLQNNS
jgi:hypothetical protein